MSMRVGSDRGVQVPSRAEAGNSAKEIKDEFVRKFFNDDGLNIDGKLKIDASALPKGSAAAKAFTDALFVDSRAAYKTSVLGQTVYAVDYQSDESHGLELFDKSGKAIASYFQGDDEGFWNVDRAGSKGGAAQGGAVSGRDSDGFDDAASVRGTAVDIHAQPGFVTAVKDFFEVNDLNTVQGQKHAIDADKLPSGARKVFDELDKTWGPDYAPTASQYSIQGKSVFAVADFNDGGMELHVFDAAGREIASGGAGESTEFAWSKSAGGTQVGTQGPMSLDYAKSLMGANGLPTMDEAPDVSGMESTQLSQLYGFVVSKGQLVNDPIRTLYVDRSDAGHPQAYLHVAGTELSKPGAKSEKTELWFGPLALQPDTSNT